MGRIAGLEIKKDISLGNVLVAMSMLVAITGFGISIRSDVDRNTVAINAGILPGAERRVTALETQVNIELNALRSQIVDLKEEIRLLRSQLRRSDLTPGMPDRG